MSTLPSPVGVPVTVGTSSAQVIAPNLQRVGLYLFNPSATIPIWICPSTGQQSAASPGGPTGVASINGAGSIVLQPQQGLMLGAGASGMPPFTNGINAICSTPSTPMTIWEFYP